MEEEDVRGDRGLSVFRLRAVSRLTLVVRCTEIGYSVSTQVLGFRFGCGWCCVVGFLFGCCWFCVLLLCVSAWWNRGFADEVTMASYGRAVTGTAVMARSANEEKKKSPLPKLPPHEGALSSNELPAKPTRRPTEGHDQMGEWIQPSPDSCVYCYRNAIHLTPLCDAFPLEGIPVSLCYCIGKIYKKMHYMVGYDGCLHEACGCSLDSPPVYNPMHLRPSMVRVCSRRSRTECF